MKILLLGASGFLGRNVILGAPDDWQIVAVYRSDTTFPEFAAGVANVTALKFSEDSDQFREDLKRATQGEVDSCIIVWGNSDIARSVADPLYDLHANVTPVLSLLEAIDMGRIVFMSSGTVYLGNTGVVDEDAPAYPTVPYGVAKLATELYIRSHVEHRKPETSFVIARFFGAFGPYEPARKIYTKLVEAFHVRKERTFTVRGDGSNLIDAMAVADAASGLIRMATTPVDSVTVNFAACDPCSINDLIHRTAATLGVPNVEIIHEGATMEPISFIADAGRMRELFDFQPKVSFEDGILALRDHLDARGSSKS